jgi:sugar phosphate isomerase/epimerase
MNFGVNLSFAVKRWTEPHAWARLVRETLGLNLVQFTFDLLDPWSPEPMRSALTAQVRQAARAWDIEIHSAFVGLAGYTYNGLLHPDPAGRRLALEWWRRAVDVAADIGAEAVGGPLGGMSVQDSEEPVRAEERYHQLLGSIESLSEAAAEAGLRELLIEPTPLERETPHTVDQAQHLLDDLSGRVAVPVRYVIDVGHALYQPLYGPAAEIDDWLEPLSEHIGMVHLQNTDFKSDSHWGWPDDRGMFDLVSFAQSLRAADLDDVPVLLEVFYPFELADEEVLSSIKSSVVHCSRQLNREQ